MGPQAELRLPVRQARLAASRRPRRRESSRPSATSRRRSRSPTRSSAPYKGLYAYDKSDAERASRGDRDDRGLDAGEGQLRRGVRRRARHRPPLSAEERVAALSRRSSTFPGSGAIFADKFDACRAYADFVPKSGRALLAPDLQEHVRAAGRALKSDYPEPTAFWRDHMIAWSKDLGRSLDYLETRKDIDRAKLAYLGPQLGQRRRADPPGGRGPVQGGDPGIAGVSSSRRLSRRPTRSTS